MTLKIIDEVSEDPLVIKEMEQFLVSSLRAYNFAAAGTYNPEIILLTVRDGSNNVQAGLKGVMSSKWLFIDMLWVAEPYRHQGYGSELLLQLEKKAKAAGCIGAFLDTHSYQAPGFYQKHGYKEFGRLENFPPGHSRIYFSKAFQ